MEFSNAYFEDEVRDGFFVPGMMKRLWASQLEILEDIEKVCKKYNLTYYADMGTLLGAVRHHGYIPWDDDFDICMKREDYNTFFKVVHTEMSSNYSILSAYTEPEFCDVFARIVNSREYHQDREFLEKYHECPYATGIDIFPLDYVSSNEEEDAAQTAMIKSLLEIIKICAVKNEDMSTDIINRIVRAVEEISGEKIDIKRPIKQQIYILIDKISSIYKSEESEEMTLMYFWAKYHIQKFPKEYFDGVIDMPFEEHKLPVPVMYDAILSKKYGNYMNIVKKWNFHEYPVYKNQERTVESILGRVPHQYYLDYKARYELGKTSPKSSEDNVISKKTIEMINILAEATRQIQSLIENSEIGQAMELLIQCQEFAIEIGTLLENMENDGVGSGSKEIVHQLELFCENVYEIYQIIQEVDAQSGTLMDIITIINDNNTFIIIDNLISTMKGLVPNNIKEKKIVIFILHKQVAWKKMYMHYLREVQDENKKVYVIPIPYHYKRYDGEIIETKQEIISLPDYMNCISDNQNNHNEVEITAYKEFDFNKNHINKIYIDCSFDEFNESICVPTFFYSTNLRKYTDELIYIPYYEIDDFDESDERSSHNIKIYCNTPGSVYSDKIIVSSEAIRKMYIKTLTEFAGENTKEIWERKVVFDKASISDLEDKKDVKKLHKYVDGNIELPDEWKKLIINENGETKKVILFTLSSSTLLEYKEKMIDKIKRALATFKNNRSKVVLWWYENTYTLDVLKLKNSSLYQQYKAVIDDYINQGWGIYDSSGNIKRAVAISDAYYGDPDYAVNISMRKGIPVMVMNVEC